MGYVALSRARLETLIYAVESDLDRGEHLPPLASADALNRVARALEQTAAEPLALDLARQSGIELEL